MLPCYERNISLLSNHPLKSVNWARIKPRYSGRQLQMLTLRHRNRWVINNAIVGTLWELEHSIRPLSNLHSLHSWIQDNWQIIPCHERNSSLSSNLSLKSVHWAGIESRCSRTLPYLERNISLLSNHLLKSLLWAGIEPICSGLQLQMLALRHRSRWITATAPQDKMNQ